MGRGVDLQITLFVPLLAILFYNSKKWGYVVSFALIVLSWIINYFLTVNNDLKIATMDARNHIWLKVMISKPYTRLTNIALGTILAVLYMDIRSYRRDPKSHPTWNYMHKNSWVGIALVVIGFSIIVVLIFWSTPFNILEVLATPTQNGIWMALSKTLFLFAFCCFTIQLLITRTLFRAGFSTT